jgi:hypothetical protein
MNTRIDNALRQALQFQAAPADLREALLAEARRRDRARRLQRTRRVLQVALAASLVLALGLGATLLRQRTDAGSAGLAQAVLADFMGSHDLAFEGAPPQTPGKDPCACWSKGCMGFEATLPRDCQMSEVRGGRSCRVKGMPAACYLLRDGGSLYVFPKPLPGAGPARGRSLAVAASYQASAWNENGRGYVRVMPR